MFHTPSRKLKKVFRNKITTVFSLLAIMLVMSLGTPALAALQSIGPTDQATGFPTVVTDFNGVTLGQCLDPFHCAASPTDLPFPDQPISFPDNIADEIFWYMAEAAHQFPSQTPGALPGEQGSMLLVMVLEGAFAGGPVLVGDNIFFSRIRFRADGLVPGGAYTVTHPYGTINVTAEADGTIFVTDDCGMGGAGDTGAYPNILTCPIGPFLQWDLADPAIDPITLLPLGPPPAGFIGSITTANHVTGSPFGTNIFKLEGPGLGLNGASTRLFTLVGKLSTAPGQSSASVKKATYTRPTVGPAQAKVFATSTTTSQMTVSSSGGAGAPLIGSVIMEQVMDGLTPTDDFFANVDLVADMGGNLPTSIIVSDTTLNPPLNALSASLVDVVTISEASYDQGTNTLTVAASSSDEVTVLSLVIVNLPSPGNEISALTGTLSTVLNAPINSVTVQSSQGGVATAIVSLVGPGSTNFLMPDFLPPVANAGVDRNVFMNSRVELSAGGSTGTIASYSWTQTGGPAVTFSNASTAEIHFIYPDVAPPAVPPTLTFKVSINGPGGMSSDIVNVNASATPPTVASISFAQVKRQTGKDGFPTENWVVEGVAIPVVAGSTVTNLFVTGPGGTVDLIASTGGTPLAIGVTGSFDFKSKDSAPAALIGTALTIHAVMSDGTVGPSLAVVVENK